MPSFTASTVQCHPVIPFIPALDAGHEDKAASSVIAALRCRVPGFKLYTQSSPQYESLRSLYNKHITARPLAICGPTTVAQVQAVVETVASFPDVPLGVSCGGHDVFGRGCVAGSVAIDMRELDTQMLAADRATVTIGGGVVSKNLVRFLDAHGLCTSNELAGVVGWAGWASWGGYGPLEDYVGMGVDNIVGAKLVTARGELLIADDDILWALRGAGGNLGVIVELTVKVYPIADILAGFIAYPWEQTIEVLLRL